MIGDELCDVRGLWHTSHVQGRKVWASQGNVFLCGGTIEDQIPDKVAVAADSLGRIGSLLVDLDAPPDMGIEDLMPRLGDTRTGKEAPAVGQVQGDGGEDLGEVEWV